MIGADAIEARLGGYSGPGVAKVSILDGIRQQAGRALLTCAHAPGPGRAIREFVTVPSEFLRIAIAVESRSGLSGEYFDNNRLDGTPRLTRTDPRIDFRWTLNSPGRGIPFDWYSARWTGTIVAPPAGVRRIGVEGNDGYRLYLDDALVDRQLAEAVVRHPRGRRRVDAGLVASDPARVLREHRHRAAEAAVGRGRRR